jgi:hypothetical protein
MALWFCDPWTTEVNGFHPNHRGSAGLSDHAHQYLLHTAWGGPKFENHSCAGGLDSPFRFNDNRGASTAFEEGCSRSTELNKEASPARLRRAC